MKNIYTLFTLFLAGTVFSQTFSAYKMNPTQTATSQVLTNGGSISIPTAVSSATMNVTTTFKVKIVNNSATTQTITMKRKIVANNPPLLLNGLGNIPDTYFCFGYNCFPSSVSQPGVSDFCVLGASGSTVTPFDNSKDNGTPFVIDLDEGLTQGYYIVSYTLYNVNNVNDSLMFYVRYNEYLSVKENNNTITSLSNIYPNPVTNVANLDLVLKGENTIKIDVYNSIGVLVHSVNEEKLNGTGRLSFDCSKFRSGLYFVTVSSGDSKITRRLIVN